MGNLSGDPTKHEVHLCILDVPYIHMVGWTQKEARDRQWGDTGRKGVGWKKCLVVIGKSNLV